MANPTAFQILQAAESSVSRANHNSPNAVAETIAAWLESALDSPEGVEFVSERIHGKPIDVLEECRLWLEDNQPMPVARMWKLAAKVRAAITELRKQNSL